VLRFAPDLYIRMAKTIYIRCIYGKLGREITKYTVIYGACTHGSGQPYAYAIGKHSAFRM
jgi:hypothetical protein